MDIVTGAINIFFIALSVGALITDLVTSPVMSPFQPAETVCIVDVEPGTPTGLTADEGVSGSRGCRG